MTFKFVSEQLHTDDVLAFFTQAFSLPISLVEVKMGGWKALVAVHFAVSVAFLPVQFHTSSFLLTFSLSPFLPLL